LGNVAVIWDIYFSRALLYYDNYYIYILSDVPVDIKVTVTKIRRCVTVLWWLILQ